MHIGNIDFKNFKLKEVLVGCGHATVLAITTNPKYDELKKLAAYRLAICKECPLMLVNGVNCYKDPNYTINNVITGQQVEGCSCLIRCKTALPNAFCPAGKWLAVHLEGFELNMPA